MSVHVLLYLLNKLGKRDQIRGLLNILTLFVMSLINSIIYLLARMLYADLEITLKVSKGAK